MLLPVESSDCVRSSARCSRYHAGAGKQFLWTVCCSARSIPTFIRHGCKQKPARFTERVGVERMMGIAPRLLCGTPAHFGADIRCAHPNGARAITPGRANSSYGLFAVPPVRFPHSVNVISQSKNPLRVGGFCFGANDGNRTHNRSLGSCCFTTKLHSRDCVCRFRLIRVTARIACLRPRSRSLSLRQRVTRGDMCTAAAAPGARHRAATSRTVILAYLRERSTVFGKYSRGSVKDMRLYARD